ncbi:MAG: methylmalonyl-CoA epimerase [Saprospiraceae bacterium]|nr:methylmalonyl-CoA epimerase [Saprospiraceae bacterium]
MVKDFPLDHIGVAVLDLDQATARYSRLHPVEILGDEEVPSQEVRVRFLQLDEMKIELLEATSTDSPVARFISKRGEGLHHIAFRVKDIYQQMERLKSEGFELIQKSPIQGAFKKLIFFIHPKSMGGTLVEICQPTEDDG